MVAVGKGKVMGTVMYAAPEVLAREGATTASDIYSMAIVMWELVTGEMPFGHLPGMKTQLSHSFHDENTHQKRSDLSTGICERLLRPSLEGGSFPLEYRQLMTRCWAPSPRSRPPISEIVKQLDNLLNTDNLEATIVRRQQVREAHCPL